MAEFSKPDSYIKQIALLLKNSDFKRSYQLSKEMADEFPKEMMSHFLLAKSAFALGNYEETIIHGRMAFNLSHERPDMISCALLTSTAYFMVEKYDEGLSLLKIFEKDKNGDVERMLFIFSAVKDNEIEAARHAKELIKINRSTALRLIERFI